MINTKLIPNFEKISDMTISKIKKQIKAKSKSFNSTNAS